VTSGAPDLRRLVCRGRLRLPWHSSRLPGVLLGSRAFWMLRLTMSGRILGEVDLQHGFTWRQSLPTWGSLWMG
jgi:hypothetical protein